MSGAGRVGEGGRALGQNPVPHLGRNSGKTVQDEWSCPHLCQKCTLGCKQQQQWWDENIVKVVEEYPRPKTVLDFKSTQSSNLNNVLSAYSAPLGTPELGVKYNSSPAQSYLKSSGWQNWDIRIRLFLRLKETWKSGSFQAILQTRKLNLKH